MDWNWAKEDNSGMLKRIVALLYAFASLAERVCDLPRPVRGVVFWVLRSAETIARDFVIDTALDQGAAVTPDLLIIPAFHGGDSPADAIRLSQSFRALAVLLNHLAGGNPGRRRVCITGLCIAVAASGMRFRRPPLCLANPRFAVERSDSS